MGTLTVQRTLADQVHFEGVALHSGVSTRLTISPAAANSGITFVRSDILEDADDARDALLLARWDQVVPSQLCTRLRNEDGVELSTIEHIMAALAGCGVSNATIFVTGPEVPILDGSSAEFVAGILSAGLTDQDAPARALKIMKPIEIEHDGATARLEPAETMEISFHIDFADRAIGVQDKELVMANGAFVKELSNCRTFCRQAEVDWMRSNGLALGGVAGENAVVFDGEHVEGGEAGLRHADEPVRHKMLDALGDLYLVGTPILGRYTGHKAGHAMTNKLLHALFETQGAWAYVSVDDDTAKRLPGAGVTLGDLAQCA